MRNTHKASVSSQVESAKKCFAANQLDQAEALLRRALGNDPANVAAHHLLGVIAARTARPELAFDELQKAAKLDPCEVNIRNDLGNALVTAGRLDDAIAVYREALNMRPDDEQLLNNLGITLHNANRLAESVDVLRKVTARHPDRMRPQMSLIHGLRRLGRQKEAIDAAQLFVTVQPDSPEALIELGNVLSETGQFAAAIHSFQKAIDFRPANAVAYNNMAATLREAGYWPKAILASRKAIDLQPDFIEAYLNLAITLRDLGRHGEAVDTFRQALQRHPDSADAFNGLGSALYECGRPEEALGYYRKALELRPGYIEAHNNLVYQLNFHPNYSQQAMYDELVIWNQQRAAPLAQFIKPHQNDRDPDRRLRIGYISPDFRDHVVGLNMLPLFRHHDHDKFHITCFHNSPKEDPITQQFRQHADAWHSINKITDEDVAELVRRERIDILVDLTLHMSASRLLVFARKPAPVQVTFAGYPGTTGLTTMDYRLTDPFLDPPGLNDAFYSERSIRLPHSFWCYLADEDRPPVTPLPALDRGFVVFGCLNNHVKVNKDVLALWERALRAVPNSTLLLMAPHGEHRHHVCSLLALEEGRVQFVGRLPRETYLETYQLMDICLDTFPYNGHTTSLDSFWMGVPVVTLCGQPVVSRAGFSQASNLGLTELVAHTPDEFVRIVTELAGNLPRLSEMRSTLRERMRSSPLMDSDGFARGIESAFREMWRAWCQAPAESASSPPSMIQANRTSPLSPSPGTPGEGRGGGLPHFPSSTPLNIPKMLDEALSLLKSGSPFAAEKICHAILLLDYRQAIAHHLLGCSIMRRGEFHSAAECFADSLALDPANPDAHLDMGSALFSMGRIDEAINAFQESLRQRPDNVSALGNLSIAVREAGRLDESIAALEKIAELKPDWLQAQATLAYTLHRAGRVTQAIDAYRKALDLKPDEPETLSNLAAALSDIGEFNEACVTARKAIEISPNSAEAWANLGDAQRRAGRPHDSLAASRRAVELRPGLALAHNNLGNALRDSGRIDDAISEFRKAITIDPAFTAAHSNLLFSFYFHPGYSPAAILAEHQEWNRRFALPLEPKNPRYSNPPNPDRTLRIGYVSADFCNHVVAFNILPLLCHRDRNSTHVTCYSNVPRPDAVTDRFQKMSDQWRSIAGVEDAQVAQMIADDRIDVLVDLSLHTAGNRLPAFARKPAPVQATFAGYPGTTGLTAIAFRLTDPYLDPPGVTDACYSERSVRLADSFWCYEAGGGDPEVNDLPALKNGKITFGCLNNVVKAGEACIRLWSRVLNALPNSTIELLAAPGDHRQAVIDRLAIDPSRVRFHEYQPRQQYLRLYNGIDVVLDTFPYNGHTTSLDSWFMGVPVVSLAGQTSVSRAGFSHAANLKLREFAVQAPDEFVRTAVELARDQTRLAQLRRDLRARMKASPLMDGHRFTRNVEQAFRSMWRQWCDEINRSA